ncbi:U3 small nucleolar RNA-associated protein 25 homolog [Episyrphus balteatus]|uniref:U3 small nucleolar RNA-associated protein 25 homolog n=1 Tax=Episyrphus balteatus TaxID=286459 RepID=UPI002485A6A1|nr:U3 small nucleolar RNA-associated protein 25 homolog [Episyrphus balteatus]
MRKQRKNYSRSKGKKPNFNQNKTISKNNKTPTNKRSKNFRFIQRSKEAEEQQRRHKIIEDKYKKQTLGTADDDSDNDVEDEVEEENAYEALLSTLDKNGKKNKHIESSSDEDENVSDEENKSELGGEDDGDSLEEEDEELGEEEDFESDIENSEVDDEEVEGKDELGDEEFDELEGEDEEQDDKEEEEGEEEEEEAELDEEVTSTKFVQQGIVDPFSEHFDYELSPQHVENLLAKPSPVTKSELKWPKLGRIQVEISQSGKEKNDDPPEKKKKVLLDEEHYASEGTPPQILSLNEEELEKHGIKQQLCKNIAQANKMHINPDSDKLLTKMQIEILSVLLKYQDLSLPQRTLENAEEIRFVYSLHSLNHMLKTRAKILHHNAKLKLASESKKSKTTIIPEAYQDQGLVRPKVLIIVPFRDAAFRVVNYFVELLYGEKSEKAKTDGTVINYKRFMDEYTGDTLYFPKTNPKPEDYEKTFAGNTDDNFKIGISLTKKCIKLYTEFYSSDILIASPLGLRMVVGAAGDAERDYDFLTSIEVLILDQAELFLAQNWEHLLHVLDHMHLQPQSTRNTDFSRVRPWCLNGLSRFYRQTLLCTSHELPEFRSLFSSKCSNYRGKVRVVNPIADGSIRNVFVQTPQVFHKIDVDSIENSFDRRFDYFVKEILPQFKSPSMAHCMIYVPSYFDYVRLRNYFKTETVNFVQICEYTKDAKIARARDMFFHSAAHFLLYSERAHFFRRTRIKGIRHLIFYQPPCWPNLYPELINLMQESYQNPRDGLENSMSVTILYSKYDMLQISAIIGTDRAAKLLRSNKTTQVFVAGD